MVRLGRRQADDGTDHTTRIQTVYQPGSFAPLIRIETDNGEREKAQCRSLAEKIQQEGSEDGHGVVFPAELVGLRTGWRGKSGQTA